MGMSGKELAKLSYRELAERAQAGSRSATLALKDRAELLWQEVAFRALKAGEPEAVALQRANEAVGRNWTQRLDRAAAGILDQVAGEVDALAVANARRIAAQATKAGGGT
jgi:hypothetical protein